jgi:hypothetical protein
MWFVPKKVLKIDLEPGRNDPPEESPTYHLGRCRKHAPTINGYPVVFVNDWCGDHKMDEKYMQVVGG